MTHWYFPSRVAEINSLIELHRTCISLQSIIYDRPNVVARRGETRRQMKQMWRVRRRQRLTSVDDAIWGSLERLMTDRTTASLCYVQHVPQLQFLSEILTQTEMPQCGINQDRTHRCLYGNECYKLQNCSAFPVRKFVNVVKTLLRGVLL